MTTPRDMREPDFVLRMAGLNLTPDSAAALAGGEAVVVPVTPIEEMVKAGEAALEAQKIALDDFSPPIFVGMIYAAMLAASPYRSGE